jgi:hypothetical protein
MSKNALPDGSMKPPASSEGREEVSLGAEDSLSELDIMDRAALHGMWMLSGGKMGRRHITENEEPLPDSVLEKIAARFGEGR